MDDGGTVAVTFGASRNDASVGFGGIKSAAVLLVAMISKIYSF